MEDKIKIVEFIINNDILVVFLFLAVVMLRNPREIIQSLDVWKSSKTSALELALKSKYLKGSSRTLIEDKLEQRHFYLSTGLNAEKLIRQKILDVYAYSAGRVKFRHFVRVNNRYGFDDSVLSLKWGYYELFSLWLLGCAAFISLVASLALILLVIIGVVDHDISNVAIQKVFSMIAALSMTGIFYLYCWMILMSTSIVRKEITAFNESNSSSETNEFSGLESNF
jgi:hypothetical protein